MKEIWHNSEAPDGINTVPFRSICYTSLRFHMKQIYIPQEAFNEMNVSCVKMPLLGRGMLLNIINSDSTSCVLEASQHRHGCLPSRTEESKEYPRDDRCWCQCREWSANIQRSWRLLETIPVSSNKEVSVKYI